MSGEEKCKEKDRKQYMGGARVWNLELPTVQKCCL